MKALKEKRIGLRSLWRRGLVILSLFALLLAAGCSSDSGGDEGGSGSASAPGKTIVGATIVEDPAAVGEAQYAGFPIKLDGIKALVRYNDNTTGEITDPSRFIVGPAQGSDSMSSGYYVGGYPYYDVYLKDSGNGYNERILAGRLDFSAKGVKEATEIHWHGSLGKKTYYSDDIPDFSGISLEIKYDELSHKVLQLPKDWDYWNFSERTDPDQPFLKVTLPGAAIISDARIPLDEIYYAEKIEFDPAPAFADPTFVFETTVTYSNLGVKQVRPNVYLDTDDVSYTPGGGGTATKPDRPSDFMEVFQIYNYGAVNSAWLKRVGDSKLKVTYTGGEARTYSLPEVASMRYLDDWRTGDPNPDQWRNYGLMLIDAPVRPWRDSDADGATDKKANAVNYKKGAAIQFQYRGIKMDPIKPPIYGTYIGITVASKDGQDVKYSIMGKGTYPDSGMDNVNTLAKKLTVTATYGLYTDKTNTATIEVDPDPGAVNSSTGRYDRYPGTGAVGAYTQGGPNDADDVYSYYGLRYGIQKALLPSGTAVDKDSVDLTAYDGVPYYDERFPAAYPGYADTKRGEPDKKATITRTKDKVIKVLVNYEPPAECGSWVDRPNVKVFKNGSITVSCEDMPPTP
jgi:hypothetical protein